MMATRFHSFPQPGAASCFQTQKTARPPIPAPPSFWGISVVLSVLTLGLLIGMRHALEADHVAAVASLATRSRGVRETTRLGIAWGVGHTVTLFVIGTAVLLMDSLVPETVAHGLELAVGVMLVLLGLDVLRRLIRDGIHFHVHQHNGERHVHAHGHSHERPVPVIHDMDAHRHAHRAPLPWRAVLVGLVHGMAGSAALVVLTLSTIQSAWQGMLYIALFGFGSIVGMALLSVIIALPLRFTASRVVWFYKGLSGTIGVLTTVLGASVIWQRGFGEGGLFF
jgi:ABC-type nickel/cobalt efflux system permease component RcnA